MSAPLDAVPPTQEADLSDAKSNEAPPDLTRRHSSRWSTFAISKLVKLLGPEKGSALFEQVLIEIQRPTLDSADDLLAFGLAMARQGGFVEAMGVVLQTYAILRATPPEEGSSNVGSS